MRTHAYAPCPVLSRGRTKHNTEPMAKGRAKKKATADGGGRSTEGVPEKKDDMAPVVKGSGDDQPANEVVVSVPVHCEGCARKLRRSLLRTEGFEEVIVDSSTNTVVVTGQKAVEDPMMVAEMVERRTRKKVLLLSPSPAKLPPSAVKSKDTKKEAAGADMKNDVAELDMKMAVVLKIEMHCEACSEEMKKRILKIKGVEEAVPHMKSSQLMVKGVVEPATLVGFIHKCTGRKAAIIRAEPLDPPPAATTASKTMDDKTPADANAKQQKPSDNPDEKNKGTEEETKQEDNGEGGGGGGEEQNDEEKTKTEKQNKGDGDGDEDGVKEEKTQVHMSNDATSGDIEEKKQTKDHQLKLPAQAAFVAVAPETEKMAENSLYEYYYHPPYAYAYPYYPYSQQYQYPYAGHPAAMYRPCPHYPPQTLGDENPDACTIM